MDKKTEKVLSYMLSNGKYTFVDMLSGDFSGLDTFGIMEGNGLKGLSGETIEFQCCTISRGTKRELQLRSYDDAKNKAIVDERLIIGDLFPGHEVIIITGGDSLYGFAPVFNDKLDLALWLRELKQWHATLTEENQWGFVTVMEYMIRLAKFLYRNNPDKVASELDDL